MGRRAKPPPPPDYTALAQQQAQIDQQATDRQTRANRVNQVNPWGSTSWEEGPNGQWTQRTSVDPRLQGALDSQMNLQRSRSDLANSMMGRVGESLAKPFDLGGMPQAGAAPQAGMVGNSGDYVSRAGDAVYNQMASRLNPRFQQQEEAMRSRMANMGYTAGNEGWDKEFGNFSRDRNDAYDTAMRSATQLAGSEASRMQGMDLNAQAQSFGQQLQQGNFQNQLRNRGIQEALMQRRMPLDEMNSLLSGQGVDSPNFESFNQAGMADGPNVYGAARDTYDAQVAQTNARNASRNSRLGGVTSLIGAGAKIAPFFMSDKRVKDVIGRIGATERGTPIYLYRKDGDVQMGVLAQEVPDHARRVRADGYYEVNYEAV